jgi:hypothetical protein
MTAINPTPPTTPARTTVTTACPVAASAAARVPLACSSQSPVLTWLYAADQSGAPPVPASNRLSASASRVSPASRR